MRYRRNRVRMYLIAAIVVLLPHQAFAACNPLLVILGGGTGSSSSGGEDKKRKDMRHYQRSVGKKIQVHYWSNGAFSDNSKEEDANLFHHMLNGFSPVVLVGHSLGGQAAHEISQLFHTPLVVTLDPVGFPEDGGNRMKPYRAEKWINVHTKGADEQPYVSLNMPGMRRVYLTYWRREAKAINVPLDVGHRDARDMYDKAKPYVLSALQSCTPSSSPILRTYHLDMEGKGTHYFPLGVDTQSYSRVDVQRAMMLKCGKKIKKGRRGWRKNLSKGEWSHYTASYRGRWYFFLQDKTKCDTVWVTIKFSKGNSSPSYYDRFDSDWKQLKQVW